MRIRRLVALAALAAAPVLSACNSDPASTDPGELLGVWAYRSPVVEVHSVQGVQRVRFVDQVEFRENLTYHHARFVIPEQTDELLGFLFIDSGTFTLRGEQITVRVTEQHARTAEPWSLQTTRIQSPGYVSRGEWAVTDGSRLDLYFKCDDTASCAPPIQYTRAPSTLD